MNYRSFKNSVGFSLTLLTLCGCAESFEKLRRDISRLEGGLNDLRAYQAEQTTKISQLESQIRNISGRVDELEFAQNKRLGSALDSLKSDVSALRRRVPPPPIVPAQALEEDERQLERLPKELSEPAGEGLQALREGNFEKALSYWDEMLYLAGGTEWAPMAAFWRAVALDGLNEHKKALEVYHGLAMRFPKYYRTPLVLLREASLLIRMGDNKTAKLVLNKLLTDYPKSNEAAQARQRLKDL